MEKRNLMIRASIYTLIVQLVMLAIIFGSGLLDPLCGLIALGINFFILNSYFIYQYFYRGEKKEIAPNERKKT